MKVLIKDNDLLATDESFGVDPGGEMEAMRGNTYEATYGTTKLGDVDQPYYLVQAEVTWMFHPDDVIEL